MEDDKAGYARGPPESRVGGLGQRCRGPVRHFGRDSGFTHYLFSLLDTPRGAN